MTEKRDKRYIQAQDCARCGSCTAVCPVYRESGGKEFYSARGRQHLRRIGMEEDALATRDVFFNCLLCGACKKVCPKDIDTPAHVRAVRADQKLFPGGYKKYLVEKVMGRPELLSVFQKVARKIETLGSGKIPAESGLNIRLAMLNVQGDVGDNGKILPINVIQQEKLEEILFFPGCTISHLAPEVIEAHRELLAQYGMTPKVPEGLVCCGTASMSLGDFDGAARLTQKNIEIFEQSTGPILVSCASCYARLTSLEKTFLPDSEWYSRAQNIAERFVDLSVLLTSLTILARTDVVTVSQKRNVFYHDPCHARHSHDLTEEPRTLLRNCEGLELVELVDGPQCCGLGGLFHIEAPKISAGIRDDLAEKVFALNPEIITTTCSGCLMQWRAIVAKHQKNIKVLHLTETLCL